MKSLYYLLLAIMSVCFLTPIAQAGLVVIQLDEFREKQLIFAHTGQDPVYRSLGGIYIVDVPLERGLRIDEAPSFDLVDVIVQNALHESNWTSLQSIPNNQVQNFDEELYLWNNPQTPILETLQITVLGGWNVPAPSALLLLLSGLAIYGRRNK